MKKVLLIPFLFLLASCGRDDSRDTFVLETSTSHTIKVVEPDGRVCIDRVVYIKFSQSNAGQASYTAKFNAETSKVETCGIPK